MIQLPNMVQVDILGKIALFSGVWKDIPSFY